MSKFAFHADVYRAHNPPRSDSVRGKHTHYALDKDVAEAYRDDGGTVKKHRVALKNPMVLDTPGKVKEAWEKSGANVHKRAYPDKHEHLYDWAKAKGHDGLVVPHSAFEGEDGYREAGGTFGEPQAVKFKK